MKASETAAYMTNYLFFPPCVLMFTEINYFPGILFSLDDVF